MYTLSNIGDLASIIGLLLGIVGFTVTIIGVWRSKKAAKLAQDAAEEAEKAVLRSHAISDVSSAVTGLQEIKRLHRARAWELLPDQYSKLRSLLIGVKASSELQNDHRAAIQGAVQHLADMEKTVEKSLIDSQEELHGWKLNDIISRQMDKLTEVLEILKGR